MAAFQPGTYEIYTQLPGAERAYLGHGLELPTILRVSAGKPFDEPIKWKVEQVGAPDSHVFTIKGGVGHLITLPAGDTSYLYLAIHEIPSTEFSIESGGNNPQVWRVHIPNKDSFWTLDEFGAQVRLSPSEGLPGQTWTFTKVDA